MNFMCLLNWATSAKCLRPVRAGQADTDTTTSMPPYHLAHTLIFFSSFLLQKIQIKLKRRREKRK